MCNRDGIIFRGVFVPVWHTIYYCNHPPTEGCEVSRAVKAMMHDLAVCVPSDNMNAIIQKVGDRGTNNWSIHEYANTIPSNPMSDREQMVINNDTMSKRKFRIRKLTERECFRLMDVKESDIDKIQASGISKSQQYKMAGNSIVVNCMYHLFRKLLVERGCEDRQLSLWG